MRTIYCTQSAGTVFIAAIRHSSLLQYLCVHLNLNLSLLLNLKEHHIELLITPPEYALQYNIFIFMISWNSFMIPYKCTFMILWQAYMMFLIISIWCFVDLRLQVSFRLFICCIRCTRSDSTRIVAIKFFQEGWEAARKHQELEFQCHWIQIRLIRMSMYSCHC